MKTLMTKALLLAGTILVAGTLPAFAQTNEPLAVVTSLATPVHMPFGVSMFVDSKGRMHLHINRDAQDRVSIRLLDSQQTVVYAEGLRGKRLTKYSRTFNFDEVKDGLYSMQISCNGQLIVRSFEMKTWGNPQPEPFRLLSMK